MSIKSEFTIKNLNYEFDLKYDSLSLEKDLNVGGTIEAETIKGIRGVTVDNIPLPKHTDERKLYHPENWYVNGKKYPFEAYKITCVGDILDFSGAKDHKGNDWDGVKTRNIITNEVRTGIKQVAVLQAINAKGEFLVYTLTDKSGNVYENMPIISADTHETCFIVEPSNDKGEVTHRYLVLGNQGAVNALGWIFPIKDNNGKLEIDTSKAPRFTMADSELYVDNPESIYNDLSANFLNAHALSIMNCHNSWVELPNGDVKTIHFMEYQGPGLHTITYPDSNWVNVRTYPNFQTGKNGNNLYKDNNNKRIGVYRKGNAEFYAFIDSSNNTMSASKMPIDASYVSSRGGLLFNDVTTDLGEYLGVAIDISGITDNSFATIDKAKVEQLPKYIFRQNAELFSLLHKSVTYKSNGDIVVQPAWNIPAVGAELAIPMGDGVTYYLNHYGDRDNGNVLKIVLDKPHDYDGISTVYGSRLIHTSGGRKGVPPIGRVEWVKLGQIDGRVMKKAFKKPGGLKHTDFLDFALALPDRGVRLNEPSGVELNVRGIDKIVPLVTKTRDISYQYVGDEERSVNVSYVDLSNALTEDDLSGNKYSVTDFTSPKEGLIRTNGEIIVDPSSCLVVANDSNGTANQLEYYLTPQTTMSWGLGYLWKYKSELNEHLKDASYTDLEISKMLNLYLLAATELVRADVTWEMSKNEGGCYNEFLHEYCVTQSDGWLAKGTYLKRTKPPAVGGKPFEVTEFGGVPTSDTAILAMKLDEKYSAYSFRLHTSEYNDLPEGSTNQGKAYDGIAMLHGTRWMLGCEDSGSASDVFIFDAENGQDHKRILAMQNGIPDRPNDFDGEFSNPQPQIVSNNAYSILSFADYVGRNRIDSFGLWHVTALKYPAPMGQMMRPYLSQNW